MAGDSLRLKLGRMDVGSVLSVSSIRLDGDRFSLTGKVQATDATHLAAIREQLLGLTSTVDARDLPIVSLDFPEFTGWYTDVQTSVEVGVGELKLLHHPFTLTATALPGRDAPGIELLQVGGFRTNDHSLLASSMQPWVAVPEDVECWWDGVDADSFDLTRVAEDGDVGVGFYGTGLGRRVASYGLDPSLAYRSAPKLSIAGADGVLQTVTGRGLFSTTGSHAWQLDNGLCRVTASGSYLSVQNLLISGASWDTARTYTFLWDVGLATVLNPFVRRTVIRNTAHDVTIRFTGSTGLSRHSLDIKLRRGARQIECVWRTDYGVLMSVERTSVDTATNLTVAGTNVGVVESSGTSLFHLATPIDFVPNTDGGIGPDGSVSEFPFCIGWTGFFPVSGDGPSDHAAQYLAPMEAWQRVVGR